MWNVSLHLLTQIVASVLISEVCSASQDRLQDRSACSLIWARLGYVRATNPQSGLLRATHLERRRALIHFVLLESLHGCCVYICKTKAGTVRPMIITIPASVSPTRISPLNFRVPAAVYRCPNLCGIGRCYCLVLLVLVQVIVTRHESRVQYTIFILLTT